jgi:acyl-CoA dehydrogenase
VAAVANVGAAFLFNCVKDATMTQTGNPLFDMAGRLFGDLCRPKDLAEAETGRWPDASWLAVEAAGLPGALIPEDAGGFGASPVEAFSVLRAAGEHALPLPLGETMLAGLLLAKAGIAIPTGPISVPSADQPALKLKRSDGRWTLVGSLRHVPWGRHVKTVVAVVDFEERPYVVLIATDGIPPDCADNVAREPRDSFTIDSVLKDDDAAPSEFSRSDLRAMGAAMRTQQIAGALSKVTAMSVRYAEERVQFGRPIGKFQSIQQSLAVLATQTEAANAAADLAAEAVTEEGVETLAIGCAKVRCGEAASLGSAIAHQIHGAFGFTHEHSLHFYTRRLLSWRDEFGNETEWSRRIGQAAIDGGPDRLWYGISDIGAPR